MNINGRLFVKVHYLSFVHFLSMILGGGINESVCVFEVDLAPKMHFILNCFVLVCQFTFVRLMNFANQH